jgi:hypothetical protein
LRKSGSAVANRRLTIKKWAKANFINGLCQANMLEHVSSPSLPRPGAKDRAAAILHKFYYFQWLKR